jgi:hypothetical protein
MFAGPQGRLDTHFSQCGETGLCNRMRLLLLLSVAAHHHSEGQSWGGSLGRFLRLIVSHLVPGVTAASIVG